MKDIYKLSNNILATLGNSSFAFFFHNPGETTDVEDFVNTVQEVKKTIAEQGRQPQLMLHSIDLDILKKLRDSVTSYDAFLLQLKVSQRLERILSSHRLRKP